MNPTIRLKVSGNDALSLRILAFRRALLQPASQEDSFEYVLLREQNLVQD
jgi:hypothetical protein